MNSNPTSEWDLKKTKPVSERDICIPMFFAALFTVDKTWKQPKCPSVDERIKKNGILFTHKKERNFAICNSMDEL